MLSRQAMQAGPFLVKTHGPVAFLVQTHGPIAFLVKTHGPTPFLAMAFLVQTYGPIAFLVQTHGPEVFLVKMLKGRGAKLWAFLLEPQISHAFWLGFRFQTKTP